MCKQAIKYYVRTSLWNSHLILQPICLYTICHTIESATLEQISETGIISWEAARFLELKRLLVDVSCVRSHESQSLLSPPCSCTSDWVEPAQEVFSHTHSLYYTHTHTHIHMTRVNIWMFTVFFNGSTQHYKNEKNSAISWKHFKFNENIKDMFMLMYL